MKNIDHLILRSEKEWQRYRYEKTGVFESLDLLYCAAKRSLKHRFVLALQSVKQGRGPRTFHPTYDENKTNIVISLTSTDKRIRHIIPTLNSLIAQDKKADLIVLWLGKGKAYPGGVIRKIKKMGITIKFRKDIGPYTKYFYAFREFKDDLVITVDDDIIYHSRMTGELYGTYLKDREAVTARRVHKIRFDEKRNIVKYLDWIWEYRDSAAPSHDLFATGVGGVLYPPSVMSLKIWENTDFLKICPKADDIWLKFCELISGIMVLPVRDPGYYYDVTMKENYRYSLNRINIKEGANDRKLQSCAEYFGIKDDLCERTLGFPSGEAVGEAD